MLEKLKARLRAEESKLGKFLIKWGTIILGSLAAFSHMGLDQAIATKLANLPPDYIPSFIKWLLSVLTFISPIAGKLTTADECSKKEGEGQAAQ